MMVELDDEDDWSVQDEVEDEDNDRYINSRIHI